MSITKKLWGYKEHIHSDGIITVDRLFIVPGGYCSKHSHKLISNRFYVLRGTLKIEIFQKLKPESLQDCIVLSEYHRDISIPPGNLHRFFNHGTGECEVIEVAYILNWNSESDIDRLDIGGVQ